MFEFKKTWPTNKLDLAWIFLHEKQLWAIEIRENGRPGDAKDNEEIKVPSTRSRISNNVATLNIELHGAL